MTITSRDLNKLASDYYDKYRMEHPSDSAYDNKYPAMCGIMAAQAAQLIREASHLTVNDTDAIEIIGYCIMIYKDGLASQVKGSLTLSRRQFKHLLRQLVTDWADEEPQDWTCVDLAGLED